MLKKAYLLSVAFMTAGGWLAYWGLLFAPCTSMKVKGKVKSLSPVRLFATPWTVAHQAPLSMILQARILEWVAISFSRESS